MPRYGDRDAADENAALRQEIRYLQEESQTLRAALNDVQMRLQLAFSGPDTLANWTLDLLNGVMYSDSLLARMIGVSPERAATGTPLSEWQRCIHPDDLAQAKDRIAEASQMAGRFSDEFRLVAPDGDVRWLALWGKVETDANGRATHILGIASDRTERKRAEEKMRMQLEEIQGIMEAAPVALCVSYDPECRVIVGNPTAARFLNVEPGTNLSSSAPEGEGLSRRVWYRDGVRIFAEDLPMQRAARTGEAVSNQEVSYDPGDGSIRHFLINALPLFDARGTPRGAIGTFLEITERRRAEEHLRFSEERFRLAAEAANGMVYEWRVETDTVWRSEGLYDLTGYRVEEARPDAGWWTEQAHPDDMVSNWKSFQDAVAAGVRHNVAEYRVRRKDGRWIHVMDKRQIEYNPDGSLRRIVGNSVDVTERKQQEQALRESEARYRTIAESAAVIVSFTNTDGVFNRRIPGWEAFTGQKPQDYLFSNALFDMMHPDDREPTAKAWDILRPQGRSFTLSYRLWHQPTQSYRHMEVDGVPVRDEDGTILEWVGMVRDIHDRVLAQEALRQQERELHAVNARLQRAMRETHHRIKNNLQVVTGMVELHTDPHNGHLNAEGVQRVVQHIRTLAAIHDLLTGEASQGNEAAELSVTAVLERLVLMLSETSGGREFATHFDAVRLPVREVAALALIVSEAVSNAVKHSAGRIAIDFRVTPPDATVQITDDGAGFPDGFRMETHANTGLDLMAHTASHDLRGRLFFDNAPGGGARITVRFPLPGVTA